MLIDCSLKPLLVFKKSVAYLLKIHRLIHVVTVVYGDMYSFDPAFNIWSKLSPVSADSSGAEVPPARYAHGFTAAEDNMIYLFGGLGSDGPY